MAPGIDVFFTGLMLICLDGQPNCPIDNHKNTAWVVKADGKSEPCGCTDKTETKLQIEYSSKDFYQTPGTQTKLTCTSDKQADSNEKTITCTIPDYIDCVELYPAPAPTIQTLESSLKWLPRINEVDRRFKALRRELLEDTYYVPTRIRFPAGAIGAGPQWPPEKDNTGKPNGKPRRWFRSNGKSDGALPRELSDRLKATYKIAERLGVRSCDGETLIDLTVQPGVKGRAAAIFRNFGDPLKPYNEGRFYDLSYLIWYYRLGSWNTTYNSCPDYYLEAKKDAVLLRCVNERDTPCWYYDGGQADTKFWPPILGPRF